MPTFFRRAPLAIAALLGVAVVAPALGSSDEAVAAVGLCGSDTTLGSGGEYHPITPDRVFDSRDAALDVEPFGKKPTSDGVGTLFNVPILGEIEGMPEFSDSDRDGNDDHVLAVVANITVTGSGSNGYLRAFGAGAPEGESSAVNFAPFQDVANSSILRPGADGELSIRLYTQEVSEVHVIIDVFGWFSSCAHDERGARVVPAGPGRVYDSREVGGALGDLGQTTLDMRGIDTIQTSNSNAPVVTDIVPDSDDVVGVLVNLTSLNPGAEATHVSLLPDRLPSGQLATTSNLNLDPDDLRSTMAFVPLNDDGQMTIYNYQGRTEVIIDVVGYLLEGEDASTRSGRVIPLVSPFRSFDTRDLGGLTRPLGPGRAETWSFEKFIDGVTIDGSKVGPQLGSIGNLTATNLVRQYPEAPVLSYVTAYPPGATSTDLPEVSNISIGEGESVPNMSLLRYSAADWVLDTNGDQRCAEAHCVSFYNAYGFVDYIYDASAVILAD